MRRVLLVLILLSIASLIGLGVRAAPEPYIGVAVTPTRAGIFLPFVRNPPTPTPTNTPMPTMTATATPQPVPLPGIANGGFEQGHVGWVEIPGNSIITQFGPVPPYAGQWEASLGGGTGGTDELQQQITLPQGSPLWLNFASQGDPNDTSGSPLFRVYINTVPIWTDYPLPSGWQTIRRDVSAFAGQTVTLRFVLVEGQSHPGGMIIDDVYLSR